MAEQVVALIWCVSKQKQEGVLGFVDLRGT